MTLYAEYVFLYVTLQTHAGAYRTLNSEGLMPGTATERILFL